MDIKNYIKNKFSGVNARDKLKPKGRVEIFVTRGPLPVVTPVGDPIEPKGPKPVYRDAIIDFSNTSLISKEVYENIIVNVGKDRVITSLTTGFIRTIARMAIGDRGTIPSDPTVPKVPTSTMTALYDEVFRSDIDVTTLNVGTPTIHEVKFIKTFSALTVPITSFSNQANPAVNEVALILCDLLTGAPLPRPDVAAPNTNLADEEMFSIRCFKSVPFEAANEIAVTIRYSIYIE
jgi:hypothetical protein